MHSTRTIVINFTTQPPGQKGSLPRVILNVLLKSRTLSFAIISNEITYTVLYRTAFQANHCTVLALSCIMSWILLWYNRRNKTASYPAISTNTLPLVAHFLAAYLLVLHLPSLYLVSPLCSPFQEELQLPVWKAK